MDPTTNDHIDASTLVAPAVEDTSKGSANRFDELLAKGQAVKEASPDNLNNGTDPNDVTFKHREQAKPEKVETKAEPEKPTPDGVPDFSKKPEKVETKTDATNYDDELKAHPAVKGEAAKSFKAVLAARDEAKKAADALKAELEAVKASATKTVTNPDHEKLIADLQKQLAAKDEEVGRASFQNTPRFKQSITAEQQELEAAKSYLDGDESMQAAVEVAAGLTGQKRLKALVDSGMNSETIASIAANLARVDAIRRDRAADVANWKETSTKWQQEAQAQQAQQEAQRREYEDSVFKTVLSKATSEDGLEGFRKVEGFDDWNRGVDEAMAKAKRLFNGEAQLPELGDVIVRGLALPAEQKLRQNLQKKYDAVSAELARLKAPLDPKGSTRAGADKAQDQGTAASRFDARLHGG